MHTRFVTLQAEDGQQKRNSQTGTVLLPYSCSFRAFLFPLTFLFFFSASHFTLLPPFIPLLRLFSLFPLVFVPLSPPCALIPSSTRISSLPPTFLFFLTAYYLLIPFVLLFLFLSSSNSRHPHLPLHYCPTFHPSSNSPLLSLFVVTNYVYASSNFIIIDLYICSLLLATQNQFLYF